MPTYHCGFDGTYTLNDTKYSSPVPKVGLYIIAATLVCMFLMIYDILVAFDTRKRWIPCEMFKLNSITLTFVTIAVKLTVDMTTPMPTVWDQLSKLCGTSLLCAYMSFIIPSVGVMNDSTNIYSLSILVITVFVNMCIQIHTQVVVLFIELHYINLFFLLVLLGMCWGCVWELKFVTRHTCEKNKNFFRTSKETVLERLKICYLYGYGSDTQFIACKGKTCTYVGLLNAFSFGFLITTIYLYLVKNNVKLCKETSDYKGSMHTIVVTQIFTVIVGGSVSIFRGYKTSEKFKLLFKIREGEPYKSNPIWPKSSIRKDCWESLLAILVIIKNIVARISTFPTVCHAVCSSSSSSSNNVATEEFKFLIQENIGIDKWTLAKGLTDMEKEIEVIKSEPNELCRLLSRITPSQQLQVEHIWDRVGPIDGESIPAVSTLSVVLLVRIAQVCLPKHLNNSLMTTFQEVYEFICFIEKSLYLTSLEFSKKLEVAMRVWLADDFTHLVVKTFDRCATTGQRHDASLAIEIIAEVKSKMPPQDMIYSEISIIQNFICRRQYSSIKQLSDSIEQLYVDMLHVMLAQFPTATLNALITESTGEEYHEKVRLALKFIIKLEQLEDRIQWKFPQGCNFLGLITVPVL